MGEVGGRWLADAVFLVEPEKCALILLHGRYCDELEVNAVEESARAPINHFSYHRARKALQARTIVNGIFAGFHVISTLLLKPFHPYLQGWEYLTCIILLVLYQLYLYLLFLHFS